MFSIDNILFTLGGNGVSLLELLSVIAGLTCVFLAGRNNKYNFWVGYLYNILLAMLFWQRHLYSAMLLQPISFCINAFGHWRWTHPHSGEESSFDNNSLKVMERAGYFRPGRRSRNPPVGFRAQPSGERVASGHVFSGPQTVAGCIRADADPFGPIPLGTEEMGLLGGLAAGQRLQYHPVPLRRTGIHAHRQCPVPDQWTLVDVDLDETL